MMEVDNVDFDVMSYLNLSDDNLSSICEDFDFDLDAILGYEGDNASDGFSQSGAQQGTNGIETNFNPNSGCFEVNSNSSCPDSNESYFKRSHKIVVPVNEITDDFKNDIKDINALIVDIDKDTKHHSKYRRKLKSNSILETLLSTPNSQSSQQKITRSQHYQKSDQRKDKEWFRVLARFAHHKGSYLLPKVNESDYSKAVQVNEKLQNNLTNVDWNSDYMMKSLCKGNIENYISQKGYLLLPKLHNTSMNNTEHVYNNNNTDKTSISSRNTDTSSDQSYGENNFNTTYGKGDGLLKDVEPKQWKNSELHEDLPNLKIRKDSVSLQDENNSCVKDRCKNLSDLSNHPQYRIRYLILMQHRLKRIDRLPVPTHEIDLDINNSITEDEKIIMREFFKNNYLTSRYIQIRNHILKCWKLNKPWYTSKTYVRYGLRNHGDVNVLGLVHRYLERIGAINFGCQLVHYAVKKEEPRILHNKCT